MRRVEWKRIQREGQQGERLEAEVLFVSQLHKTEGHASFRGCKATAGAGCVSGGVHTLRCCAKIRYRV